MFKSNFSTRRKITAISTIVAAAIVTIGLTLPSAASSAAAPCAGQVHMTNASYTLKPHLVGTGDTEFSGHGPSFYISAILNHTKTNPDRLEVVIFMHADETQSDWTQAQDQSTTVVYRAASGCKISEVGLPETFDATGGLDKGWSQPAHDVGKNPRSFVSSYDVWTNHSGPDVGSYTGVRVNTKAYMFNITL